MAGMFRNCEHDSCNTPFCPWCGEQLWLSRRTNTLFCQASSLAIALGVPVKWLKDEAENGRIPSLKVGNRRMYNSDAVRTLLAKRAADGNED